MVLTGPLNKPATSQISTENAICCKIPDEFSQFVSFYILGGLSLLGKP